MNASTTRLFRAFADETRLRILHLLTKGEICVCDIMAVLRIPQPKVSRHLAYLKRAGLVVDRKDGLWRHYSLAAASTPVQKRLLGCIDSCREELTTLQRDAAALSALKKSACR